MAIPSTGVIRLSMIQGAFGGSNPIRLSEYYRQPNGLTTTNNTGVPLSDTIKFSDFRGGVAALVVEYQIIGAGGAGGYGRFDSYSTTRSASGGDSSITGSGITTVTAAGGIGGLDAAIAPVTTTTRNGESTIYGRGGVYGQSFSAETYSPGGDAPSTSYGAGGGGGGGDESQIFDRSGGEGGGGGAGTYRTGSFLLPLGTQLSVTIGLKGVGVRVITRGSEGGDGANGYARIRKGGGAWTEFTESGIYTV